MNLLLGQLLELGPQKGFPSRAMFFKCRRNHLQRQTEGKRWSEGTGRGWDCSRCTAANPPQKLPSNHPRGQDAESGHPSRAMTPRTTLVLRKPSTERGVPMCQGIATWPTAQMQSGQNGNNKSCWMTERGWSPGECALITNHVTSIVISRQNPQQENLQQTQNWLN